MVNGPRKTTDLGEFLLKARTAAGTWNPVLQRQVPMPYREVSLLTEEFGARVAPSFLSDLEKGHKVALRDPERLRGRASALQGSYADLAEAAGYEGIVDAKHSLTVLLHELGLTAAQVKFVEEYVAHSVALNNGTATTPPEAPKRTRTKKPAGGKG
jgi:hypothetical protein